MLRCEAVDARNHQHVTAAEEVQDGAKFLARCGHCAAALRISVVGAVVPPTPPPASGPIFQVAPKWWPSAPAGRDVVRWARRASSHTSRWCEANLKAARVRDGAVAFEVRAAASRLMRKASSDPARIGNEAPGEVSKRPQEPSRCSFFLRPCWK